MRIEWESKRMYSKRLSLVPGKRTVEYCEELVEDVKQRTCGRLDMLITCDEHAPY